METFIGILLGGSFLAFLQFLITRHDNKHDKFKEIIQAIADLEKKVDLLDAKGEMREAVNKRVRILRFEDELQEDRQHSKDSFAQVMSDITEYENYTERNPSFKNRQTEATIAHISKVYNERLEKHDWT
jgi:hypothetical protein